MNQKNRITIAEHTLEVLNAGKYTSPSGNQIDISSQIANAVGNTKLYTPDVLEELAEIIPAPKFETTFEVENITTLDAVRMLAAKGETNTMALNFASAKNAGGGFLGGAQAQEESIARASALYPCLQQAPEYYSFHRNNRTHLYSDHMIYSPDVPVFKDEEGNLMETPVCTTVITSAAVNKGAIENNERESLPDILPLMKIRIDKMLALCVKHQHQVLILGAWGCGVFRNEPDDIAQLFKEALHGKYAGQFRKVLFAVKTNNEAVIEPFRKRFS
ncbi:TIGR02452 family protein [Pseudoflavitalea sp. G-6-1-2]|uniref:TIGR02452 family protein n=1 Tax=Pseudoflavitalea sp. G-6-1-2 TaxID=2728841 RepID=UPI001469A085|nr:TIGR02452 family protein [Pseudoflavitalea sp. G-6-1-2]NML20259.1 TIGR02452 family protein [Pseudoflavitalea sp. G-6-1-2]